MGFSRQEYWSDLPFPSPVDHTRSDLSTMTCPSWVALHGMAHSFTELVKAVVHVIRLVSFLCLWFSDGLPTVGLPIAVGLLYPEPLPLQQATAGPYLLRRHSNTELKPQQKMPTTWGGFLHSREMVTVIPTPPDARWPLNWRNDGAACILILISHSAPWTIMLLIVTPSLGLGHTVLRAWACCGPLWQSNKAICFYFTQTLSLSFNLVWGYRGQICHPSEPSKQTVFTDLPSVSAKLFASRWNTHQLGYQIAHGWKAVLVTM